MSKNIFCGDLRFSIYIHLIGAENCLITFRTKYNTLNLCTWQKIALRCLFLKCEIFGWFMDFFSLALWSFEILEWQRWMWPQFAVSPMRNLAYYGHEQNLMTSFCWPRRHRGKNYGYAVDITTISVATPRHWVHDLSLTATSGHQLSDDRSASSFLSN